MERAINPIRDTLASFVIICDKKEIVPYFKEGGSEIHLHEFFYQQAQNHKEEFENYSFEQRNGFIWSQKIAEYTSILEYCSILVSWELNGKPWEIRMPEALRPEYQKIQKDKTNLFKKIGQEFFSQFACNKNGVVGIYTSLKE